MYPTLYHAFLDLLGWDLPFLKLVNSFGFFVAMAFMVATWTLSLDLKRRETLGQLQSWTEKEKTAANEGILSHIYNALIGFLIGWKFLGMIINSDEAFGSGNPQEYLLSSKGSIPLGLLVAGVFVFLKLRAAKKAKEDGAKDKDVTVHPYQMAGNFALVGAIGGFSGAKLFHLLENPDELVDFFTNPAIEKLFSGLTIYGGLIVGGFAVIYYARTKGIKGWALPDAAAPGMILSYGVGRIGCHVSGDGDWGINNLAAKPDWMSLLPDWLWAYRYPNNVNRVGIRIEDGTCFENYCTQLPEAVFPTPLYELAMTLVIFAILWWLRKKTNTPGMLFGVYMIFNGIERFFIEKIRVNNVFELMGMEVTQAEVISTLVFLSGLALVIVQYKRGVRYKSTTPAGNS